MRKVLAFLTLAVLVSACAGATAAEDPTNQPSETSAEDAGLAYAECMRENGIDMPDPEVDAGGMQQRLGEDADPDSESFRRADEQCSTHLEGMVQDRMDDLSPEERERLQEQMLELAECMRERGYDMPDPQIGSSGVRIGLGPDEGEGGIDPRDPEFGDAIEACHEQAGLAQPGSVDEAGGASDGARHRCGRRAVGDARRRRAHGDGHRCGRPGDTHRDGARRNGRGRTA
jgi:hypothetical protein